MENESENVYINHDTVKKYTITAAAESDRAGVVEEQEYEEFDPITPPDNNKQPGRTSPNDEQTEYCVSSASIFRDVYPPVATANYPTAPKGSSEVNSADSNKSRTCLGVLCGFVTVFCLGFIVSAVFLTRTSIKVQELAKISEIPGTPGYNGTAGVPGTNGSAGIQGETGLQGLKGDQGLKGSPGSAGVAGITGAKGSAGVPGIKGAKGEKGASASAAARSLTDERSSLDSPGSSIGGIFTRWGRSNCPANSSLIFSGVMTGAEQGQFGGSSDILCLPQKQQWLPENTTSGTTSTIEPLMIPINSSLPSDDTPALPTADIALCAQCFTKNRPAITTIPAWTHCPQDWTLEYSGYLMTRSVGEFSSSDYVCVDYNPDHNNKGSLSEQDVLQFVKLNCGDSIKECRSGDGHVVTCVVCSN